MCHDVKNGISASELAVSQPLCFLGVKEAKSLFFIGAPVPFGLSVRAIVNPLGHPSHPANGPKLTNRQ